MKFTKQSYYTILLFQCYRFVLIKTAVSLTWFSCAIAKEDFSQSLSWDLAVRWGLMRVASCCFLLLWVPSVQLRHKHTAQPEMTVVVSGSIFVLRVPQNYFINKRVHHENRWSEGYIPLARWNWTAALWHSSWAFFATSRES